jgi:upstream activation factor subunit UAF30
MFECRQPGGAGCDTHAGGEGTYQLAHQFLAGFPLVKSNPLLDKVGRCTYSCNMTKKSKKARKIVDKVLGKDGTAARMKPVQPDSALGAVVGVSAAPRTTVSKRLWAYIKKNDLQDKKRKVIINADAKLKPVFGGRNQVTMFEMTKLVNKHLKD